MLKIDSLIQRGTDHKTRYITNQNSDIMITVIEATTVRNSNFALLALAMMLPLLGITVYQYRGIFIRSRDKKAKP